MLNNIKSLLIILIYLLVVFIFHPAVVTEASNETITGDDGAASLTAMDEFMEKKVLLITLDKLLLDDLLTSGGPLLRSILEESAVSLMNVNTAGLPGTEGGYATIGAGARLQGHWAVRLAFNRKDSWQGSTAEALYRRHTGVQNLPPGAVIHPYWMNLVVLNRKRPYPAHVGALGETLRLYGLSTAVLGNADTDEPGRQAVTMAMDSLGTVTLGDVGSTLLRTNDYFPFGLSSDPAAYLEAMQGIWEESSLIVMEWGDSSRIDAYREHLTEGRREQLLESSLENFDQLLAGILPYLDHNVLLILLSPSPPKDVTGNEQRMTPLVVYEPSRREGGLIRSGTTRRPGIIANIDIAPTVLKHLGLEAPFFLWGAPLESVPASGHLLTLREISTHTVRVYQQRPSVIRGFILSLIITSLLGVLSVITRFKFLYPLRYFHCVLLNFPAVLLVAAAFPPFPAADIRHSIFWLFLIALPLTIPALLLMHRSLTACFAYSGLIICTLLIFDLWQGGALNSRSLLGYDPIGGARFYGLGNEYMGVLIGSFVLGAISLFSLPILPMQREIPGLTILKGCFFGAASLLLVFIMASPIYGANFGGAVTAGFALAVALGGMLYLPGEKGIRLEALCLAKGKKGQNRDIKEKGRGWFYPPRLAITGLLVLFITTTALFVYFLNAPGGGDHVSHLGRTWELVRSDGLVELKNVAVRKMEMNFKLIRYSLWSRVLLGFIALLAILYYYPVGLMRSIFRREPFFKAILGATILGSVVAFCLNDSGVVAAATIMLYGGLPLFMLSMREVFS